MRKLFTLLASVLLTTGAFAQEQVTITWPLDTQDDLTAKVEGNGKDYVEAKNVKLGSNLSTNKTSTANGITGVRFVTSADVNRGTSGDNSPFYVQFPFSVKEGYVLTITGIFFNVSKDGSGNDLYENVLIIDPSENKRTIVNGITIPRNTTDGYFEGKYYQKDMEDANANKPFDFNPYTATKEDYLLTFNPFCSTDTKNSVFASGKSLWFNSVVIKGEVIAEGATPDTRDKAPISWSAAEVSYKVRDKIEGITLPTLTKAEDLDINLVYASSDPTIASVDASTGVVTLQNEKTGKATISATYTGTDESKYKSNVAEYTIEVVTNVVGTNKELDPDFDATLGNIDVPESQLFKLSGSNYSANAEIAKDNNITVTTPNAMSAGGNAAEYFGISFNKAGNLRVNSAPTSDKPEGEPNGDTGSSIVIEPQTDLTFIIFNRRQSQKTRAGEPIDIVEKNEITNVDYYSVEPNDGKNVNLVDQENIDTPLDNEVILAGSTTGIDYWFVANVYQLKAGKKYTAYAMGTTLQLHAVAYLLDGDVPAAPSVKVDGDSHDVATDVVLENGSKELTFEKADESHHIYYRYDKISSSEDNGQDEVVAGDAAKANTVIAKAAAKPVEGEPEAQITHNNVTYDLLSDSKITLDEPGTVSFLVVNPTTGLKSEIQTVNVVSDGTTSIADIAADANAAVEYFNLQGIRVDNPENGIFIRRQGNSVSKVVVK